MQKNIQSTQKSEEKSNKEKKNIRIRINNIKNSKIVDLIPNVLLEITRGNGYIILIVVMV